MNQDQLKELKNDLSEVVKKTVNGKIDKIQSSLDAHIIADHEWKANVLPAVKMMEDLQSFGNVAKYLLGVFIMIATAVGAAYELYLWIRRP